MVVSALLTLFNIYEPVTGTVDTTYSCWFFIFTASIQGYCSSPFPTLATGTVGTTYEYSYWFFSLLQHRVTALLLFLHLSLALLAQRIITRTGSLYPLLKHKVTALHLFLHWSLALLAQRMITRTGSFHCFNTR